MIYLVSAFILGLILGTGIGLYGMARWFTKDIREGESVLEEPHRRWKDGD